MCVHRLPEVSRLNLIEVLQYEDKHIAVRPDSQSLYSPVGTLVVSSGTKERDRRNPLAG